MGVSLQIKMGVGQEVTVAKFADLDTTFVSTATIVGNPDLDRACRNKVKDARRLLETYSGGLQCVLAYGSHVREIEDLCRLVGVEATHEQ